MNRILYPSFRLDGSCEFRVTRRYAARKQRSTVRIAAALCHRSAAGSWTGATDPLPARVGVITLYGAQLAEIRRRLAQLNSKCPDALDGLDVHSNTVDRFQGMERQIVIVSLVRSCPRGKIGEFAKQYQRINVALSRAQHLLVIIGAMNTFADAVVELPDMEGAGRRQVRAYGNIHDLITEQGGRRDRLGYDQMPTGSNFYNLPDENFGLTVRWSRRNLAPQRLLGFLQTP